MALGKEDTVVLVYASNPLVALLVALPLTRQLGYRWPYDLVKVEAVLVLVAEPIVPRLLPLCAMAPAAGADLP